MRPRAPRRRARDPVRHLRAMDFDPDKLAPLLGDLDRHALREVLVLAVTRRRSRARRGSTRRDRRSRRGAEAHAADLRVYAAIDPDLVLALRDELESVHQKRDAGADGFFEARSPSDRRLQHAWADLLAGEDVYWGVTPIAGDRSRRYWETKNRAVFPAGFAPTLEWSRRFAAEALAWARERDADLYFMPIRVDAASWLGGLLAER